jgi:hypothetical protein
MWRYRFGSGRREQALLTEAALTEQDVYAATAHATSEQQKTIMELMLQHKAGTLSSAELRQRIYALMQPEPGDT